MKVALVIVLALLAFPSNAKGVAFLVGPDSSPQITQYFLAQANEVWHSPCRGEARIEWRSFAPDRQHLGYADRDACLVIINADFQYDHRAVCHIILHEVGHLASYHDPLNPDSIHSSNPKSVMYPWIGVHHGDTENMRVLTRTFATKRCKPSWATVARRLAIW